MSIKTLATKEVRQFYLIPLDRIDNWEGNNNRVQTNRIEEYYESFKSNAVVDNVFNPSLISLGAATGFVSSLIIPNNQVRPGDLVVEKGEKESKVERVLLTDGFQRYSALKKLQEEGIMVPGLTVQMLPANTSKSQLYLMQLNSETANKTPLEVATVFKEIIDNTDLRATEIAKQTRYSDATVSNYLRLIRTANDRLFSAIKESVISFDSAVEIIKQLPKDCDLTEQQSQLDCLLDQVLGKDEETSEETSKETTSEEITQEEQQPKKPITRSQVRERLAKKPPDQQKKSEAERKAWFAARDEQIITQATKLILESNFIEEEHGRLVMEVDPVIWKALAKAVKAELPQ